MDISPIGPDKFNQIRDKQALEAAFLRGEVGRLGKKEHKTEPEDKLPHLPHLTQLPRIKKAEQLPGGLTKSYLADGRSITQAPNGVIKEKRPDGSTWTSLPNGVMVVKEADGKTWAYDPTPGKILKVKKFQESPKHQVIYQFRDSDGNRYQVASRSLKFEIANPTKTLKEEVHASGSMHIDSKTLFRDPKTGRIKQDSEKIYIEKDGRVHEQGSYIDNVNLDKKSLKFTQRKDLNIGINLPYEIPKEIYGPGVSPKPPDPTPPTPEPQPEPPAPNPTPPAPGMPWPGNAYAPVMAPSGLMRQQNPDGNLFISLPNGTLVHQAPDGRVAAFDARLPNQPLPVEVNSIENPGKPSEKEYNFTDAAGNRCTAYSVSLDFALQSKDQKVQQLVFPNGTIMILAKTPSTDPNGQPVDKLHRVAVYPNGRVNTFGEKGVSIGYDRIGFKEGGNQQVLVLPYPIPPYQSLIGQMLPVMPPFANSPVSGNFPAGYLPPVNSQETKAQAGVNKSLWQKIKAFFTANSQSERDAKKILKNNRFNSQTYCNSPYGSMEKMLKMQFGLTTVMTTAMMLSSIPSMFFFTPFMF